MKQGHDRMLSFVIKLWLFMLLTFHSGNLISVSICLSTPPLPSCGEGGGVGNVFYYLSIVTVRILLSQLLSCFNDFSHINFINCFFLVIRWLNRLLCTGAKRPLQAEDLYGLLERDKTDTVTEQLERF